LEDVETIVVDGPEGEKREGKGADEACDTADEANGVSGLWLALLEGARARDPTESVGLG